MRGVPPRLPLYFIIFFGLALACGEARAAQCSDIYPGARIGPPPEWNFWADGSACFIRWVAENVEEEERLLAQCRNTSGARFVHFEPDRGKGHSICIFKVHDMASADISNDPGADATDSGPVETSNKPVQPDIEKLDEANESEAESPVVRLERLVRERNEECIALETANRPLDASQCWKTAADAVEQFTLTYRLPTRDLETKLGELRSAWRKRGAQLEGTPTEARVPVAAIEPATAHIDGPDPHRLSATAACSSTRLGANKHCLSSAVPNGGNEYSFRLNSECTGASLAAVSTINDQGRCLRRVILLDQENPAVVHSHETPEVIDAVTFQDGIYECYARRHENISCDGRIDYSDPGNSVRPAEVKKPPKKETVRKKPRRKVEVTSSAPKKQSTKTARVKKRQPKKEATLKVTKNYTKKEEEPPAPKKPRSSENQNGVSFRCLLFSKLC
jgi:hypothetical protein